MHSFSTSMKRITPMLVTRVEVRIIFKVDIAFGVVMALIVRYPMKNHVEVQLRSTDRREPPARTRSKHLIIHKAENRPFTQMANIYRRRFVLRIPELYKWFLFIPEQIDYFIESDPYAVGQFDFHSGRSDKSAKMAVSTANLTDTPKTRNAPRFGRGHKRENVTVTATTDFWCIRVENEIGAALAELGFRRHTESLRSREGPENIELGLTIWRRSIYIRGFFCVGDINTPHIPYVESFLLFA
jgi:hypothetical protein